MSTQKSSNRLVPWVGGFLIACVAGIGLTAIAGWWPSPLPLTDTQLVDDVHALQIDLSETNVHLANLSDHEFSDIQRIDATLASLEQQLQTSPTSSGRDDSRRLTQIILQLKAVDTDLTTLFNRTSKPAGHR
ncbi:MAG: hypothetical protein KGL39_49615 [Patescibacteria group bacterium]|nr:hypothetical protein [Patescibacteria group bacterium]